MSKKSPKKSRPRLTKVSAGRSPDQPLATPAAGRNLWIALGVSLFLHAVLLTLHFKFPDTSRAFQDKALDIILVNSKSARKPTNAQALAQANLDGGGNTDENRRAKTPLPPSARQQSGSELEQAQKRVQALEAQQQRLLEKARSKELVAPSSDKEAAQPDPVQGLSGRDLASSALAMARLEGEISRSTDEYNKRPRLKTIGARAREYVGAAYLDSWDRKVERIGTVNFPAKAKGNLYGMVTVWVVLSGDGSLQHFEIRRSSGYKILDDAAKRIVEMGQPYGNMPKAMLEDAEHIGFSRRLEFTNSNQLETRSR